jgi:hypothetical protein
MGRCPRHHLHEASQVRSERPLARLSGCCRFGQRTVVGTRGNGRDAPIPAVRETAIGPTGATAYEPLLAAAGGPRRRKADDPEQDARS